MKERELSRLLKCPLLDPSYDGVVDKIIPMANWVLRKSFDGKLNGRPDQILHEIRGRILEDFPADGTLARVAGYRLLQLVLHYEVVHLEQPYSLSLSGYTIEGKYALLRKRSGAKLPHVLVLHDIEPDIRNTQAQPPDVVTLSRYVHVLTATSHKDARVLHYPVIRGSTWTNRDLKLPLAKRYLESMLKVATLRPEFPVVGGHCESCATKRCMEVFTHGQDDDSGE